MTRVFSLMKAQRASSRPNRFISTLLAASFLLLIPIVSALSGDDALLLQSVDQAANASLLWGTYRPNLYFGTRPRLPESLMTGLMWFDASIVQGFQRVRHTCDQGDRLNGYGYHKHDGRDFASQKIKDGENNIEITTEFIKVPGGQHGGDWGVRIRGELINPNVPTVTSVFFYLGLEGDGSMDIVSPLSKKGLKSPVVLEGDTPDLGDFEFQIVDGPLNESPGLGPNQDLSRTQWVGLPLREGDVWKAKDILLPRLLEATKARLTPGTEQESLEKPYLYFTLGNELIEEDDEVANLYAFQKVFKGGFQFDVLYRSKSGPNGMTSESLGQKLTQKTQQFDADFEKAFHLREKGFKEQEIELGQFLLSNLLGGIGYYYGSSVVDRSHPPMEDEEHFSDVPVRPEHTKPHGIFTASPSRPFFPRGFFWDEGFHQLLIGKWDNDLSLDIIKHWVSLIDENGWIEREQILGDEARSRVPSEFQTQFPHYANPPTLYLAIKRYVDRLGQHHSHGIDHSEKQVTMTSLDDPHVLKNMRLENPVLAKAWLESVYPKLRLNWQWFRSTQRGHLARFGRTASNQEAYRWRGRTPDHTLTSGFDDYPRGEPPNVGELHADLLSWMAFATRLLKDISSQLGPEYADDVKEYTSIEEDMLQNLEDLHWNEEQKAFCDQTINEQGKPVHVCHKGYPSLLPLCLGLLPVDSPKLKAILDDIEDEKQFWSPYGLRSLSASDEFYNTGEIYWRGPIWININYLTLQSLYNNYMHVDGPYRERATSIYTALRKNLISTVYKDYRATGFVWEQYSDETGKGQRSHPFTGWTSLILLIMAEEYS